MLPRTLTSADLSDNNEYFLHDDEFLCKNQMPMEMASPAEGPTTVGLMGRMLNVRLSICRRKSELIAD